MPGFFIFNGAKLRAVREQVGQSREQLALGSGLAASSITVYENGHGVPSRAALIRLATALGVNPSEFVDEDPMFAEAVTR